MTIHKQKSYGAPRSLAGPAPAMLALPNLPTSNPFSRPSRLPYGLEDYANITIEHLGEAFVAAMQEDLRMLDAVCRNPAPATFENTVRPLENSLAMIARVWRAIMTMYRFRGVPQMRSLHQTLEPQYQAHMALRMTHNKRYFRCAEVLEHQELSGEELHLVRQHVETRKSENANLRVDEAKHLAQLRAREANLIAQFARNLAQSTKSAALWVENVSDLGGLTAARIHNMREAAQAFQQARFDDHEDGYLFNLMGNGVLADLAVIENRDLRERVFRAHVSRMRTENQKIVTDLASVRAAIADVANERSYMHLVTSWESAKTPENVLSVLDGLLPKTKDRAESEFQRIQRRAVIDGIDVVEPWDIAFYTERIRLERRGVEAPNLLEHLELGNVINRGLFYLANQLYGVNFLPRPDLTTYHEDVLVWEVFDGPVGAEGDGMALLLIDPFAREFKLPIFMECSLQNGVTSLGAKPIVLLGISIPRPVPGAPCLLSCREVKELFQGLGRAMHNIFASSTYCSGRFSQLPVDVRNYAAALHGRLVTYPGIFENFLLHYETGEPLAPEIVAKMRRNNQFGSGLEGLWVLAHSYLDMAWHTVPAGTEAPSASSLERDLVQKLGIQTFAPFLATHLFEPGVSGRCAARYYAHLWCEVKAKGAIERMHNNDVSLRAFGEQHRREFLNHANTSDPDKLYRSLLGVQA